MLGTRKTPSRTPLQGDVQLLSLPKKGGDVNYSNDDGVEVVAAAAKKQAGCLSLRGDREGGVKSHELG